MEFSEIDKIGLKIANAIYSRNTKQMFEALGEYFEHTGLEVTQDNLKHIPVEGCEK